MELSEPSNVTLKAAHTNHSAANHRFCRGWWNMQDASCPYVKKKAVTGKSHSKDCMARNRHNKFPFGEKELAKQITNRSHEQSESQTPSSGFGLEFRNHSAECFIGNADGVFRAREIRRLEPQSRWDKDAVKNVIGVPWRMTDGRWTVDPIPIPQLPFGGSRPVATQSKKTTGRKPIQIIAQYELKKSLRITSQGADR